MKRHLCVILLFGIITSEIGCVSNRAFFRNKILIYNSEESGDFNDSLQNASFIDFYNDSIIVIDFPFRLFEGTKNSLDSGLYPFSRLPMKFTKRKKAIYVDYRIKDKSVHMKYFSVIKGDSITASSYDNLCIASFTRWYVITKYTGKDTTISIAGKRARCWVFKIKYPNEHDPGGSTDIVYIEKKSLLPVQRITTFWFFDQNDPPIFKTGVIKSRIVKIIKRPWDSANRRWRYMPCYYK